MEKIKKGNLSNLKDNAYIKLLSVVILGVAFFLVNLYRMNELICNSDMANMVLEAKDVLNGNIFLKDWNLTGISFISTDLLFFVIGVALFGVSVEAYVFAAASMSFLLVVASYLLIGKEKRVLGVLILGALACFPNLYCKSLLSIHTACFAMSYLSLYFITNYFDSKKKTYGVLAFLFLSMAICGDSLAIILMVLPMVLMAIYEFIFRNKEDIDFKKNLFICCFSVASVIIGKGFEKIYLHIGGANLNAYIGQKSFIGFEELYDKIVLFFSSLLGLVDADFSLKVVSEIPSLLAFGRAIIVIIGLVISIIEIVRFFKSKKYDYINTNLSIGFWCVALVYIFTNISVNNMTARYYVFAPCFLAIISARFLAHRCKDIRQYVVYIIVAVILTLAAFVFGSGRMNNDTEKQYTELITALEENNLKNGYSTFWTSSIMTVVTHNDITVRHIQQNDSNISEYAYFSKNSWYDENANFIIVNAGEAGFDEMLLNDQLGKPINCIECGQYKILIYDYDISTILDKK